MGRGSSKAGANTGRAATPSVSSLEVFRENARQLNDALRRAREGNYNELEFVSVTGDIVRRYFNGASWTDRKPTQYNEFIRGGGKLRVSFRAPSSWR